MATRTPASPALKATSSGKPSHIRPDEMANPSMAMASQHGTMPPLTPSTISRHQPTFSAFGEIATAVTAP